MWILLPNVVWYFQTIDVWQNVPPARIQESTDLKLVAERRSTTLRWSQSSLMVITNNFCFHVSSQKCLQIGQDYGCPLALQMGLWRTGGSWQGSWWSQSSLMVIPNNLNQFERSNNSQIALSSLVPHALLKFLTVQWSGAHTGYGHSLHIYTAYRAMVPRHAKKIHRPFSIP